MPKRIAFRHLDAFLVLARERSVSRAAEVMGIAQPALSQQMHLIETRLGTPLFDRNTRPLQLTEAGHYLVAEAAALGARFEAAVAEARQIGRGERGWLGLGFTRSAMYDFLPPVMRAFSLSRPDVELQLHEMLTEDQPEALRAGTIHLGLSRDPGETPGLQQEVLLREDLVVALPRRHALARRRRVRLPELAQEPFILFPKHPVAQFPSHVLALCRAAGFTPRIAQETFEIQTALGLVAAGLGVTLVTAGVARHIRSDLTFKTLDGEPDALATLLVALYRPGLRPPAVEAMLTLMRARGGKPRSRGEPA